MRRRLLFYTYVSYTSLIRPLYVPQKKINQLLYEEIYLTSSLGFKSGG